MSSDNKKIQIIIQQQTIIMVTIAIIKIQKTIIILAQELLITMKI